MPEGIVPGSRECTSHINLSRAMEYGAVGCPLYQSEWATGAVVANSLSI